jgi:hypothetical protein
MNETDGERSEKSEKRGPSSGGGLLQVARRWTRDRTPTVPALVADPTVLLVADVFGAGARIVSTGTPAVWPPSGGCVPSSGPTSPFAAEPPAVPCRVCASSTWHRAGEGWTCGTCHPKPTPPPHLTHHHAPGISRDTVMCPACARSEGPRA